MKQKNIIFAILMCILFLKINAQIPTPYTAKITYNSGAGIINATQNSTHICPVNLDSVGITAYAGWPFGTNGYLYITNGNTEHLACGSVADYDSIKIDAGGTLIIDDYLGTGNAWTIIGCKGPFVLNGTIQCRNGKHHGGTWQLFEPDSAGNLTITNPPTTIIQKNGGNGGAGGNAILSGWGGGSATGGTFGSSNNGNGGGGGGGAGSCNMNTPCTYGYAGGNANDTISGFGGMGAYAPVTSLSITPAVNINGQNGISGYGNPFPNACNCCNESSNGGSGGSRGKHGGLLYIKAMKSVTGSGTIDVSGEKGGDGGGSAYAGGVPTVYSGSGGGGGGAAGGNGGYVHLKYVGTAPTININKVAGTPGLGGIAYAASGMSPGGNGNDGEAGLVGQQQITLIPGSGYTYQWYRSGASISGATKSKLYTKLAGNYDCKIINPVGQQFWTSGVARYYRDTVYSDNNPAAIISSINPSINSCVGDTIKLTAQYVSGQTYQWLFNSVPTGSNSTLLNATQAGTYAVLVNNSCNGSVSPTVNLTFNAPPAQPSITAFGTTTFCPGGSVVLQSSSSLNNTWSANAGGLNTQTVSVNQSGNYYVTVTNNFSCTATSSSINITVNPSNVNIGSDINLICGDGVTLSPTYSPASLTSVIWSPTIGLSNSNSPTPFCQPVNTTTYIVTANFTNGCVAKDTIIINSSSSLPQICEVTVDSLSQYNNIIWDKTAYTNVDSFIVYREVSTNIYKRIGAQDKNALSIFVDTARSVGPANGDPNITSYRYKLQIRNTCGNYSTESPYHNSVYFSTNTTGTYSWNSYDVEFQPLTPVSTFDLMRDNFATGTWTLVGSCAGTQTSLNDGAYASYPTAIWRVNANGFNCNPTAKTTQQINKTKSNVKNNFNVGLPTSTGNTELSNTVLIVPNPATTELVVSFKTVITSATKIVVTDVLGKVVYTSDTQEGNSIVIPVNELPKGVYFMKIEQGKNYTVKKFIKE